MLSFNSQAKKFKIVYDQCQPYTMTSKERIFTLCQSVKYIISHQIPGDFVECGVWKGGSAMAIALMLIELKALDRKIYLYDTFKGMSEPTVKDYRIINKPLQAKKRWSQEQRKNYNRWCFSPLLAVKKNMLSTRYPREKILFIKGKVEDTIPGTVPLQISLLRLDTDWYKSTKHELINLFPLLASKGVLIIDDYGYWAGSKKATDEYFSQHSISFKKIDEASIIGIKA